MKALTATLFGGLLCVSCAIAETPIISKGSLDWKYWDQGKAPDENWKGVEYDDAAWKTGQAPLGYETDDGTALKTTVSFGHDETKKHAVTYFRKGFDVAELAALSLTALRVAADDGAVLYLNGKELGRIRMAADTVTEATFAAVKNGGSEVSDQFVEVPADALVEGKNVLAVSVHQAGSTSSDLYLDMALVEMDAKELAEQLFEQRSKAIISRYQEKVMNYSTAYRAAADEAARAALTYPNPKEANKAMAALIMESPTQPGVMDAASWLSQNEGFTDAVSEVISKHHHASEAESFAMLMIYSRYRPDPGMAPLLEKVRVDHPNKSLQTLAAFSLSNGVKESKEKEALLEEAESKIGDYIFSNRPLKPMITGELYDVRNLSIGQVAPEIEGEDIDGVAFKFTDYRGKVVVLDFWGHW